MKKALVMLAGLGLSLNVMATDDAAAAFVGGDKITAAAGCSLLGETVQMNLSSNVLGAYGCNITDSVIGVATCHTSGKKGTWTQDVYEDTDADPTTPMVLTGTTEVFGGKAFQGSTAGGSITAVNTTTCLATGGSTTTEAATISGL